MGGVGVRPVGLGGSLRGSGRGRSGGGGGVRRVRVGRAMRGAPGRRGRLLPRAQAGSMSTILRRAVVTYRPLRRRPQPPSDVIREDRFLTRPSPTRDACHGRARVSRQGPTPSRASSGATEHSMTARRLTHSRGTPCDRSGFHLVPPRGFAPCTDALRAVHRLPMATLILAHTSAYPGIFGHTCALFRGISGAFRDAHR